jgi:hypothetical protein
MAAEASLATLRTQLQALATEIREKEQGWQLHTTVQMELILWADRLTRLSEAP